MKIILMMVSTLDGIVAKNETDRVMWSSTEDKRAFAEETKKHGVVIYGRKTYEALKKPLPGRLNFVLTQNPDRHQHQTIPGFLEFFSGSPSDVVKHLSERGFSSAVLAGGPKTNSAFLKAGMVEEILLTIEPKIFGKGTTFAQGVDLNLSLNLKDIRRLNANTIQLRYAVIPPLKNQ